MRCRHVEEPAPNACVCFPLVAHGETMGILHVRTPPGATAELSSAQIQIADTLAGHIGLALSNLQLRDKLRQQSIRDVLTGLFNRRFFEETLIKERSRADRTKEPLALVMMDIDHFKSFNDTFGHHGGDAVLREVGQLLARETRGSDVACRFGGEELAVLLVGAAIGSGCAKAESLRAAIANLEVKHDGVALGRVTASFGVAAYPEDAVNADQLVQAADRALYRAKEHGRNRVESANAAGPADSAAITLGPA